MMSISGHPVSLLPCHRPRILQLTLQDQATKQGHPVTALILSHTVSMSHSHCCMLYASSLAGFVGFVPRGLVGTGYLNNLDLLDFSQMAPKKTSAPSSIAATLNPASDTYTTTLCLPCIQGYPSSKHPGN